MARIVLNTFGSLGDLHPFLAIAIELKTRGHDPVVAAAEIYREKVKAEGVQFAPVRPDLGALAADSKLMERIWDPRRGPEFLLREVLIPTAEESFEDVARAAAGADLLVTHTAAYGGHIAAEALRLRWVSAVLQPMTLFSAYDPPVFPSAPWLKYFYALGQGAFRLTRRLARWQTDRWMEPLGALRRRLGLPQAANPVFEGQFSPFGTLALFSKHFAQPQPDWPARTTMTGFVFYDRLGMNAADNNSEELEAFLTAGPPPVVFTLGSSAVMQAEQFFYESALAAQQMRRRAVLLTGKQEDQHLPPALPDSIFIAEYAPYSQLLPRSVATVHQGGIGTTAQALRAGRPMLVVPWSHDQPDNAERVCNLGLARTLPRHRYTAARVTKELERLLSNPSYAQKAGEIRAALLSENGTGTAADALEAILLENRVTAVFR